MKNIEIIAQVNNIAVFTIIIILCLGGSIIGQHGFPVFIDLFPCKEKKKKKNRKGNIIQYKCVTFQKTSVNAEIIITRP